MPPKNNLRLPPGKPPGAAPPPKAAVPKAATKAPAKAKPAATAIKASPPPPKLSPAGPLAGTAPPTINPITGEESMQPLDPTDYFPQPGSAAGEPPVEAPAAMVTYDETRADLFTPGTKHANRHSAGAMETNPTPNTVPSIFPRPGLDEDDEDDSDLEGLGDAVHPEEV
eukprot:s394_g29.t1